MVDSLAVEVEHLEVRRGRTPVLHDVSVAVPIGAVVGLLGPSGSGKTTLLRSIVGVQRIRAGTVTVLEQPAGARGLRGRIGYVTQAASVYDDLTVAENLHYFRRVLGADRHEVDRVLEATDLTAESGRVVGSLSGGQRGRVSLAAALIGSPPLLVLDEPTVGLDPVLRVSLWNLFHRLAGAGTSLLVSSHVMDEATRCDRLVLLRDGAVLADDDTRGILERTGAATAEDAFLRLIEAAPTESPPPSGGAGARHRNGSS